MKYKAIHFGAGNIGRGFIAPLLKEAGYQVVFADVNAEIINSINEQKSYRVILADQEQKETVVSGITAINSSQEAKKLVAAISEAAIITTAVGPTVLPKIASQIAEGIELRKAEPLIIIACENMIDGSKNLKKYIYHSLSEKGKVYADQFVHFPNAAVDRIVPNQINENPLTVIVEPFFEWVVEIPKGAPLPEIPGLQFVGNLTPYIERKLFTVNTGHAAAAYFGYLRQKKSIEAAIYDEEILFLVRSALEETGALLEKKFSFPHQEHQNYIHKIMNRFRNPHISDDVVRVGRSPIRKISEKDRFVCPAKQFVDSFHETPKALANAIAAALHFKNKTDEEANLLENAIKEKGLEETISMFTSIPSHSKLFEQIKSDYYQLEKSH